MFRIINDKFTSFFVKKDNFILLALSVFLVPLILACCTDFMFDVMGHIDSPLYIGYGFHYLDSDFGDNYYKISRLPWIWVQFVIRNLFDPVVGSYILFFSLLSLASLLMVKIGKETSAIFPSALVAIITPLLLITYEGGPNYHNSFSAILFLFMIYQVVSKTLKSQDGPRFFILVGAIHALIIYSNVLISLDSLIYASLFYIAIKIEKNENPFEKILLKIFCALLGEVIITTFMGLVNLSIGREFFFMKILWEFTIGFAGVSHNGWLPLKDFINNAHYLAPFFVMGIFSFLMCCYFLIKRNIKSNAMVFFLNLAYLLVMVEVLITHNLKSNNIHITYIVFAVLVPFLLTLIYNLKFFLNSKIKTGALYVLFLVIVYILAMIFNYDILSFVNKILPFESVFLKYVLMWSFAFIILVASKSRSNMWLVMTSSMILICGSLLLSVNFLSLEKNKCSDKKATYSVYVSLDKDLYKYRSLVNKHDVGNLFYWYGSDQKIISNDKKCINNFSDQSYRQLIITSAQSSMMMQALDGPYKNPSMNKINDLWKDADDESSIWKSDSGWRKVVFFGDSYNSYKGKRVIVIFSNNESDAWDMIKKMKTYNVNFELAESRRLVTYPLILKYYLLVEKL